MHPKAIFKPLLTAHSDTSQPDYVSHKQQVASAKDFGADKADDRNKDPTNKATKNKS